MLLPFAALHGNPPLSLLLLLLLPSFFHLTAPHLPPIAVVGDAVLLVGLFVSAVAAVTVDPATTTTAITTKTTTTTATTDAAYIGTLTFSLMLFCASSNSHYLETYFFSLASSLYLFFFSLLLYLFLLFTMLGYLLVPTSHYHSAFALF